MGLAQFVADTVRTLCHPAAFEAALAGLSLGGGPGPVTDHMGIMRLGGFCLAGVPGLRERLQWEARAELKRCPTPPPLVRMPLLVTSQNVEGGWGQGMEVYNGQRTELYLEPDGVFLVRRSVGWGTHHRGVLLTTRSSATHHIVSSHPFPSSLLSPKHTTEARQGRRPCVGLRPRPKARPGLGPFRAQSDR